MTTFSDIFNSSFLDNLSSVTTFDMILTMVLAFGLGVMIFFIYKKTFRGIMYSASFGVTLIALSMITALLILTISTNVVLSLGMVGALSIVRFRTAIKEPLDIAFLFWAIAVGIVLAAGMILLAVIGSVFIGLVLILFVNRKPHDNPYIIVINCDSEITEKAVFAKLQEHVNKCVVKSKTVRADSIELNYEVRLKTADTAFVNLLSAEAGVNNIVLVSYNGDYVG